jgi:hypothetical protein
MVGGWGWVVRRVLLSKNIHMAGTQDSRLSESVF